MIDNTFINMRSCDKQIRFLWMAESEECVRIPGRGFLIILKTVRQTAEN